MVSAIYSNIVLFPADAQAIRDRHVALEICPPNVCEQSASLSYQFEQTSPRRFVVRVGSQMVGKLVDAGGQDCDLDFWRTCITLMTCEFLY